MKQPVYKTLTLDAIVGGGQTIGELDNGKKALTWGGLPKETVTIQITKSKSRFVEGIVTDVIEKSQERTTPRDPHSYLSTSPWQIMTFEAEQHYKAALIEEAFELHNIVLPQPITVYTDQKQYEYRNKIEYSFWYDTEKNCLELAFFRRGTHGKIPITHTSLAHPSITETSRQIVAVLNELNVEGRALKTLLIRCNQAGQVSWQLYVKDEAFPYTKVLASVDIASCVRGEIIYSNPKSPASVITRRLASTTQHSISDTLLGTQFFYATESFFQINLPVYEQALRDMQAWILPGKEVVDLYSGVGTIGLTIGGKKVTLVEINAAAIDEMNRNIKALGRQKEATAVLAATEDALDFISHKACIIVDPPRAGLHENVVAKLLEALPERIIYLSCNPVTQARDVARLSERYGIRAHQGYNFFPRTPHCEHLVVLDAKPT
jgi:23S rRNA (uracil1939-C5)-methyltransferase